MRQYAIALALFLIPCLSAADLDIVFAASWYRWGDKFNSESGAKKKGLIGGGPSHLYRINPDGTGRTRITSGKWDDIWPRWAPDGKHILFAREQPKRRFAICLVGANGGAIRRLLDVPENFRYYGYYVWSPDSRRIAVSAPGIPYLLVLDTQTGTQHHLPYGDHFAWSPDGRKLFVDFESATHRATRCQIWDYSGRQPVCVQKLDPGVWDPLWRDRRTVIGFVTESDHGSRKETLRFIYPSGAEQRRVQLKPVARSKKKNEDEDDLYYNVHSWLRIPDDPLHLLVESREGHSDGNHYACHRVDLRNGRFTKVHEGMLFSVSPDGKRCAVHDAEWVGGYKREGQRLGPLKIVDIRTGKSRRITSSLASIAGGDWRRQ